MSHAMYHYTCVVDLHDGDIVLQRVLKAFLRERISDLYGQDVVVFDYGLC